MEDDIKNLVSRVEALEPQTQEIVLRFLDLLLQGKESAGTILIDPEED